MAVLAVVRPGTRSCDPSQGPRPHLQRPAARLAAVRVRIIQLRILAGILTALWALAFVLVLVGYRPGGPVDIVVGFAAVLPLLVALAALRWPPAARGERAFASIVWLGLGAVLLLIPSLAGLVIQLETRGPADAPALARGGVSVDPRARGHGRVRRIGHREAATRARRPCAGDG